MYPQGGTVIAVYFDCNDGGERTGAAVRNKLDVMSDGSQMLFFSGCYLCRGRQEEGVGAWVSSAVWVPLFNF